MDRKQATNEDLETLAELVRQHIKNPRPTVPKIVALLTELGYNLSPYLAQKVRETADRQRAELRNRLIAELRVRLPINPSWPTIRARSRELGFELNEYEAKKIHAALREYPELWSNEPSTTKRLTLVSPVDKKILAQLEASTGLARNASIALALRAFVLAYARFNVPLNELIQEAAKTGDAEMQVYVRMLEQFNFHRLVR